MYVDSSTRNDLLEIGVCIMYIGNKKCRKGSSVSHHCRYVAPKFKNDEGELAAFEAVIVKSGFTLSIISSITCHDGL